MACIETRASIRIFSEKVFPEKVTELLGVEPNETLVKDPNSRFTHKREFHSWFWSTKDRVPSLINSVHLDAVLNLLENKKSELMRLREKGCTTDVFCLWAHSGQGTISLDLTAMNKLSELGLDITWDIYGVSDNET